MNVRYYSLSEIVIASIRLSDQVALVVLLIVVFSCLSLDGPLSPVVTTALVASISISLYIAFLLVLGEGEGKYFCRKRYFWSITVTVAGWKFTRSTVICLLGGFTVSPILKTLTESISTDTVYAMVTIMMLMHVIFFDYGIESAIVSPPISLNASLFAAVCLASRLSAISAFTLLIFAADVFVLVSLLRKQLERKVSCTARTSFSIAVILLSVAAILTKRSVVLVSYLLLLSLLNIVFPFCFYKLQNMKE